MIDYVQTINNPINNIDIDNHGNELYGQTDITRL